MQTAGRYLVTRNKGEPTLPLINVVFLMLIFFLVTAQMARPIDVDLQLASTDGDDFVPPPDAVVIDAKGSITFRGIAVGPDAVVATLTEEQGDQVSVRILPDRRTQASRIIGLAHDLRRAGAHAIFIVTEYRE